MIILLIILAILAVGFFSYHKPLFKFFGLKIGAWALFAVGIGLSSGYLLLGVAIFLRLLQILRGNA